MDSERRKPMFDEPDHLEHRVLKQLIRAAKGHKMLIEKRIVKTGVYRSQHHLLMGISFMPNASQKELAERENVSSATVAVSLKKLEKGGYIERAVDENDNRYNHIQITEKGVQVLNQSVQIFKKAEEDMLEGFSDEEKVQLMEYLKRIDQNIKNASVTESEGNEDEAL